MDKGAIQASARSKMFGYTNREHYENIVTVSTERKQACTAHRSSRKVHHPSPLMNATGQKERYFMALSITRITRVRYELNQNRGLSLIVPFKLFLTPVIRPQLFQLFSVVIYCNALMWVPANCLQLLS